MATRRAISAMGIQIELQLKMCEMKTSVQHAFYYFVFLVALFCYTFIYFFARTSELRNIECNTYTLRKLILNHSISIIVITEMWNEEMETNNISMTLLHKRHIDQDYFLVNISIVAISNESRSVCEI